MKMLSKTSWIFMVLFAPQIFVFSSRTLARIGRGIESISKTLRIRALRPEVEDLVVIAWQLYRFRSLGPLCRTRSFEKWRVITDDLSVEEEMCLFVTHKEAQANVAALQTALEAAETKPQQFDQQLAEAQQYATQYDIALNQIVQLEQRVKQETLGNRAQALTKAKMDNRALRDIAREVGTDLSYMTAEKYGEVGKKMDKLRAAVNES